MILELIEEKRELFAAGEKFALFEAICLVCRFQAVAPKWVADAVLQIESDVAAGKCVDFNEPFGWAPPYQTTRRIRRRQAKHSSKILAKLMAYRLSGGNMNVDTAFRPIAIEIGIPWRDVEAVYKRKGQFIKALPQDNKQGVNYGFGDCVLPLGRRYDRPILEDKNK